MKRRARVLLRRHQEGLDEHGSVSRMDDPIGNFIGRKAGRKVVLLMGNCSAQGKTEELPQLRQVRVGFLPPNTTSMLQPLDAGIIAWV